MVCSRMEPAVEERSGVRDASSLSKRRSASCSVAVMVNPEELELNWVGMCFSCLVRPVHG